MSHSDFESGYKRGYQKAREESADVLTACVIDFVENDLYKKLGDMVEMYKLGIKIIDSRKASYDAPWSAEDKFISIPVKHPDLITVELPIIGLNIRIVPKQEIVQRVVWERKRRAGDE